MNISNFITWFINQFVYIGSNLLGKLDQIILWGNVSLMDFIITIMVLGAFVSIIITAPNLGIVRREMRKERAKND